MIQLLFVAAQTTPHDAALLCTSTPAVATAQSPTKPQLLKSLLALAGASMWNHDMLLVHWEIRRIRRIRRRQMHEGSQSG